MTPSKYVCKIPNYQNQSDLFPLGYQMVSTQVLHSRETLIEELNSKGYPFVVSLEGMKIRDIKKMIGDMKVSDWTLVSLNNEMLFFSKDQVSFMLMSLVSS